MFLGKAPLLPNKNKVELHSDHPANKNNMATASVYPI